MNYIQLLYKNFPTKIFKEDRGKYILALFQLREEDSGQPGTFYQKAGNGKLSFG